VITGLFDNNASATVKGNFTDTEWDGIANTIKTALNAHFNSLASTSAMRDTYKGVFGHANGVIIIIEKNPSYEKYSTTRGHIGAMHINFTLLNNIETLGTALRDATRSMDGSPSVPEVVKAHDRIIPLCVKPPNAA
jgi:hypothetical protein